MRISRRLTRGSRRRWGSFAVDDLESVWWGRSLDLGGMALFSTVLTLPLFLSQFWLPIRRSVIFHILVSHVPIITLIKGHLGSTNLKAFDSVLDMGIRRNGLVYCHSSYASIDYPLRWAREIMKHDMWSRTALLLNVSQSVCQFVPLLLLILKKCLHVTSVRPLNSVSWSVLWIGFLGVITMLKEEINARRQTLGN